jgi:gamma-glutamyltranspeptidase
MSSLESSLEEALRQAKTALLDAERQHAQLEVHVQALRTEVAGIDAALHRRREQGTAPRAAPVPTKVLDPKFLAAAALPESPAAAGVAALVLLLMDLHSNWVSKKRAAAVESVLKVAGRPVHRGDIAEALKRLGRSDTLESVSAALAYLNKSGKAHPVGDGYWAAGIVQSINLAKEVN